MDIDFVRYSLPDEAIDTFIDKINCIEGITIKRIGQIVELSQQDYHGKRVLIVISDENGNRIESKIDLGVHNRLEITQEEYCFDIAFDDEGASLLINSREQMVAEKLRSLLKFGRFSTRFKCDGRIRKMVISECNAKCIPVYKTYVSTASYNIEILPNDLEIVGDGTLPRKQARNYYKKNKTIPRL